MRTVQLFRPHFWDVKAMSRMWRRDRWFSADSDLVSGRCGLRIRAAFAFQDKRFVVCFPGASFQDTCNGRCIQSRNNQVTWTEHLWTCNNHYTSFTVHNHAIQQQETSLYNWLNCTLFPRGRATISLSHDKKKASPCKWMTMATLFGLNGR